MRSIKILISVVLMLALILSFSIVSFADPLSAAAFGGAFASFLEASGISTSASGLGATAYNDYWLAETGETENWLDPLSDYQVYYSHDNTSGTDHVWIGGTSVLDLFKQNADDYIINKNIFDNSNGNLANSSLIYDDIPFLTRSGSYFATYPIGSFTLPNTGSVGDTYSYSAGKVQVVMSVGLIQYGSCRYTYKIYYDGNLVGDGGQTVYSNTGGYTFNILFRCGSNRQVQIYVGHSTREFVAYTGEYATQFSSGIDYISGVINTSVSSGQGLDIVIPHDSSVTFPDGYLNTFSDIQELLSIINSNLANDSLVSADFAPVPIVPPGPTPTPLPSDTLGGTLYSVWTDDFGTPVLDGLDGINDTIGLIGDDIVDVIDTYGQSAVQAIEDQTDVIDTFGQSAIQAIEDQTDVIDTFGTTVTDALNNPVSGIKAKLDSIVSSLTNVVENIIEGVKESILGDTTKIEGLFAGIIGRLRSAFGIWHYVVEWVGSIGGVLAWVMNTGASINYSVILPVYACIAGGIVLGVYRRFGR